MNLFFDIYKINYRAKDSNSHRESVFKPLSKSFIYKNIFDYYFLNILEPMRSIFAPFAMAIL